jgi:hypothetical protein
LLYPLLFSNSEPVPPDVIAAMKSRCAVAADDNIKEKCATFAAALDEVTNSPSEGSEDIHSRLADVQNRISLYEQSYFYSEADELDDYKRIARAVVPWLPSEIELPVLPHPILVMIVTLSMGALGSVLFMIQLHLAGETGSGYRMSVPWHLFRPLQGMAMALAIFLLVKAGQLSISRTGGSTVDDPDLNAFVLGFLGIVSGLLSDRAMDRLTAAGIELLRVSSSTPPNAPSEGRDAEPSDDASKTRDPTKPELPAPA